jgi:hypothetical protein
MNSDRLRIATLALALTALSGCETMMSTPPGAAKLGDATRMTFMAQVVDPDPQYDEPMAGSGENAAQAVARYRAGTVKQPARVRTTSATGGGGGN